MTETTSWFDDDALLESEVKTALGTPSGAPSITGYGELREIARGGQGVVYSAMQLGTKRVVALKVLREGPADGVRGVRRFEREVDLAASLAHPNVVALFDSGTTPDGRPFLVMELIDGPTIDHAPQVVAAQAARLARPPLDALVELVAQVCDGVAYAHRRGVVHRDLKPSNVRVDRDGRPKVLDFGLAKNLDGGPGALTLTGSGTGAAFLGSLPWASPEQALGHNDDVDVRSDVYALGVVLYQLLTGRFPYDVESDLRTTLNTIVHVAPIAPRKFVGIPADLETIVLRCLQKDPDRRYQSAGDLARDLRLFLAGEAVEARRDSAWYSLRMTARRHRVAFVASALVLVSLVAGLAVSLTFWRQAEAQTKAATESARAAHAAMQFFSDTMLAVDPSAQGRDVKMVDVVRGAAKDLEHRFPGDPDAKGFFYTKLVELLRNLGDLPAALALSETSVRDAVAAWGDNDPRTIFARANQALILHASGRSKDALPILESEAARLRGDPALRTPATSHVFTNLGFVLLALDRVDDAEAAFKETMNFPVEPGRESESQSIALETLAAIAGFRGKPAEALRLLEESLPLRLASVGNEHIATIRCRGNLAFYLGELGRNAEAEAITRENVEITRRRMGPRHVDTLSGLNNQAHYLEMLGRLDEAEVLLKECLEGRMEVLGEEAPHTLITLGNLASVTLKRGDVTTAETLFRRAIAIGTKTQGPAHTDVLIRRNNLALLLADSDRNADAIETMRGVVADAEQHLGAEHHLTARFRCNLGGYLVTAQDWPAAEPLLREALRVLEAKYGATSADAAGARKRLCDVLRATGREAEAEAIRPEPQRQK
ncbi:MAG: serine/threonine protein kinase [Planctomycetes bacterium]|nr:serine/threonine protein kinase [Planctomycetota bacterium]